MKKIAIIGSGSWGVALATYLANVGNQVKIWSFSEEERDLINNEKKCKFLPDLIIPDNIYCSTSYEEVIKDTEFIIRIRVLNKMSFGKYYFIFVIFIA